MTDSLTITLDEAAEQLGISPATIRSWVLRGHLEPLNRGSRPLHFRASDVWDCAARRRSTEERERLDRLAKAWSDTPDDPTVA